MGFTSEVTARLNLDTTAFERGLTKTTADVGRAGDSIGKKLNRAFGAGDVFKGLLQGIGIGSVSTLVDTLVSGFEKAAQLAKDIAESTKQTADIYDSIFSSKRSDEQNLAANRNEQARLQNELTQAGPGTKTRSVMDANFKVRQITEATEGDPKRRAEIAKELAELSKQEVSLTGKIAENKVKAKETDDSAATAREARVQALADQNKQNTMDQLSTSEQIVELEADKADLVQQALRDGLEDLDRAKEVAKLEGQIAKLKRTEAEEAKKAREENEKNAAALFKAGAAITQARNAGTTAMRDRSGFTVGDAASGTAGSATDRAKARRIQQLEARAKRVRGMTGLMDNGKSVDSGERADGLMREADKLRGGIKGLTSSEADPMKGAVEAIKKSEEHLDEIVKSLKPSAVK